jgi:hypothetical protein
MLGLCLFHSKTSVSCGKGQKSTEMTFSYISIGPITLLTIHINSKITDNPPSNMSSNNHFRTVGPTRFENNRSSASSGGHHTYPPHATETASSTSTDTSQDEAGLREPTNSNPSKNSDFRWEALKNNTVYVAVHARSLPGSYHCGLFISRCKERHLGLGWSINNDEGGWIEKLLSFDAVFNHSHLLLLHRVGQVHEGREVVCEQKLRTLRADGTSSGNCVATVPGSSSRLVSGTAAPHEHGPAQDDMDSMARVKQAMRTLLDNRLITVCADRAEALEDDVSRLAGQIWDQVVSNKMHALVT